MHNELSLVFIPFLSCLFFFFLFLILLLFHAGVGKVKCKLLLEYLDLSFYA